MSKAFFLTRQLAELMEDFIRELNADSKLFFLCGAEGSGKTRTLEELVLRRLGDSRIHWIDLNAGGGDNALVDSSPMIETIFHKAQDGDIVIADHFERALKKSRHQLFLSWASDAADKKIDLIIAGDSGFYTEMCQLSEQYRVRAQSLQQPALSIEETVEFLQIYLFPDRGPGSLVMPELLRSQIIAAQGNIGSVIEIAEHAGDQITLAAPKPAEPAAPGESRPVGKKRGKLLLLLIAIVLLVGVGLYFFNQLPQQFAGQPEFSEAVVDRQAEPGAIEQKADVVEDEPPEAEVGIVVVADEVIEGELVDDKDSASHVDPDDSQILDDDVVIATAGTSDLSEIESAEVELAEDVKETELAGDEVMPAAEPEPDQDDVPGQTAAGSETDGSDEETYSQLQLPENRLQRDLQTSLDWAQRNDRSTGTLQIMMLSHERFDDRVYYESIDRLAARGIDTAAIRILPTLTGGREVYSIVYGEFKSWQAANDSKDAVPEALREFAPIARSVGGLRDEMRRLEPEN